MFQFLSTEVDLYNLSCESINTGLVKPQLALEQYLSVFQAKSRPRDPDDEFVFPYDLGLVDNVKQVRQLVHNKLLQVNLGDFFWQKMFNANMVQAIVRLDTNFVILISYLKHLV